MLVLNEENYNLAISCFWRRQLKNIEQSSFQKLPSVVKLVSHVDAPGTHLVHVQRFALFGAVSAKLYRPFSCSNWEEVDYVSPDQSLV